MSNEGKADVNETVNRVEVDQVYVVVTGGAPDLHLGIDYNTSGMIRDILPRQIVRSGKPTITIIKYPDDTLCIYLWMIEAVKKILSGDRALYQGQVPDGDTPFTPDLILHLGMTDSPFFEFYEFARKDGYLEPGEDGVYYPQELLVKGGEWSELPDKLFTMIDMNQMRDKVLQKLPNVNIQVSEDDRLYFCEFSLWATLAELSLRGLPAKGAFVHTPEWKTEDAINTGGKVIEELICAMFET